MTDSERALTVALRDLLDAIPPGERRYRSRAFARALDAARAVLADAHAAGWDLAASHEALRAERDEARLDASIHVIERHRAEARVRELTAAFTVLEVAYWQMQDWYTAYRRANPPRAWVPPRIVQSVNVNPPAPDA